MASAPLLLILDDEICWLNRHQQHFQRYGFVCIPTLFAKHAIHLGIELEPVKYIVVDHILRDPTQPEDERENQRHQGKEVIQKIYERRKDVKFIIVTQAIGRLDLYEKERQWMSELENYGLLDIFHKDQIKNSPDRTYTKIKNWFKESQKTSLESPEKTNISKNINLENLQFNKEVSKEAISRQDFNLIIDILARNAEDYNDPREHYNYLLYQADLPAEWIRTIRGQWSRDVNIDVDRLVRWAIKKKINPERPENTILGCILRAELKFIGGEDIGKITQIIDKYNLMPNQE